MLKRALQQDQSIYSVLKIIGMDFKKICKQITDYIEDNCDDWSYWSHSFEDIISGDYSIEIDVTVQFGKAEYYNLVIYRNGDRIEINLHDGDFDYYCQPNLDEPNDRDVDQYGYN